MKHNTWMRVLSFVLSLLMVFGMLPLDAVHVHATETHSVDNEDTNLEIDYKRPPYKVDENGDPVYDENNQLIYLEPLQALSEAAESGREIDYTYNGKDLTYDDFYSEDYSEPQWRQVFKGDFNKLREWLESDDPDDRYIVLMEDIKKTIGSSSDWESINISSVKVLDLNGHTLELYDKSNGTKDQSPQDQDHRSVFFTIDGSGYTQGDDPLNPKNGALLTVIDSAGSNVTIVDPKGEIYTKNPQTGRIYANGYMINHQKWDFWYYTHRDVFHVLNGDLVIYGGEFQAGRQKDQFKSNFSWGKLKTIIGDAVTLGVAIYEYATGITAAEAARSDLMGGDMYKDLKEEIAGSDENEQDTGKTNNGATNKKQGNDDSVTKEKKTDTPTSKGEDAAKKDQTVAQKQNDKNSKGEDEAKKGGDSKENKAEGGKDAKPSKKDPTDSQIADANKAIGNAYLDKDKISAMVDGAIALGEGIYDMFAVNDNTRATACIHGTVARVAGGCTLVVYDGNLIGHGSTPNVRDAVIEVYHNPVTDQNGRSLGGMVYVYGGTFTANTGANVFSMYEAGGEKGAVTYEYTTVESLDPVTGEDVYTSTLSESKPIRLAYSETFGVNEVRYQNLEKWQKDYTAIPEDIRNAYNAAETAEAKDKIIADYVATLAPTKREAAAKLFLGPEPVSTANIMIRGGVFRTYYEVSMMAVMDSSTRGSDKSDGQWCLEHEEYHGSNGGECDDVDYNKFTGTPGTVNLGVESFGEDMIKDGRIQLVDVYGQGKLVLLDGGDPIYENPEADPYEGMTEEEILAAEQEKREEEGEVTATPVNTYQTEGGFRQYRLYISDLELRAMQYLTVHPNTALTNSTNASFALKTYWGTGNSVAVDGWASDEDNIRAPYSSNENYFEYQFDAPEAQRGVYIMPELGTMNYDAAGEELAQSDVWYYNIPVNASGESLGNFQFVDTYMTGTYDKPDNPFGGLFGKIIDGVEQTLNFLLGKGTLANGEYTVSMNRLRKSGTKENTETYKDRLDNKDYYTITDENYRTNIKFFVYRVYRVDPLSRENINESDTWAADEPLLEMRYGATNDSLKCKITLAELEKAIAEKKGDPDWGFRSGELYRVTFSVEEHLGYGYLGSQKDGEVEFVNHLEPARAESSILFRCVGINENKDGTHVNGSTGASGAGKVPDWTPLQFVKQDENGNYYKDETVSPGGYATVELLNGQTGIIDYEGARIFDVYYQWYILDDPNDTTPTLIAGTDDVWVAQNPYGGKQFHKPGMWALNEDGTGVNGNIYASTVDPSSELAAKYELNAYGMPVNQSDWIEEGYQMLHMYTYETCNAHPGMIKDPDQGGLYMANNNTFWGNTDSIYVPAEYAGKYLQCKLVAVNTRYPQVFDNLQIIKSHAILIMDPSMLIPDSQEPEMEVVAVNTAGDTFYAETETYTLGQSKLYGFTPKTLPENLTLHGYSISATTRVVNTTGEVVYEANNGNLIDLKDIITAQGDYRVEQEQKLMLNKNVVFSRTDVFPVTATIPAPAKVDFDYAPLNFAVGEEVTFTATALPEEVAGVDYWYKWVIVNSEGALEDLPVLQDSSSETFKYTFTDETPVRFGVYAYSKADDGTVSTEGAWNLGYREIYPSEEMAYTLYVNGKAVEEGSTVCVEQNSECEIDIVINGGAGNVKCVAYKGWTVLGEQTNINPGTAEVGKTNYSFHYGDANVSTQADITIEVCEPLSITGNSAKTVNIGYATPVDLWVQYSGTGTSVTFQADNGSTWTNIDTGAYTRRISNKEYRTGIEPNITTTGIHGFRAVVTDMFGNSNTVNFNVDYSTATTTSVNAKFDQKPAVTVYKRGDSTKTDDRVYTFNDDDLIIDISAKFVRNPSSELYAIDQAKYGNIRPVIGDLTGDITIRYYESYEAYIQNSSDYTTVYESVDCITGVTVDAYGNATWTYDGDLADCGNGDPGFYRCIIYLYNNGDYAGGTSSYYNVSAEYLIMDSGEEHVCNYTYKITSNDDGNTHTWHCVCGETQTVEHAWSEWSNSTYRYNLQQRFCAESSSNVSVGGWCNTYQYRLAFVDTLTLDQTRITDPGLSGQFQLNASLEFVDVAEGYDMTGKTLVDPETGLIWTTSNENVATVDENGLVTIIGAGTATITVTSVAPTVLYVDGVLNPQYATATCEVIIDCDHKDVSINAAKASDCTNAGWVKHYACKYCGEYSLDGTFTDHVDYDTDIALPLKEHESAFVLSFDASGHWYSCRYGCGTKMGDVKGHSFNVDSVSCENEVKYCIACTYEAARHTHSNDYVPAKAATCGNDGNIEHYACINCGKMFADMAGTEPLTEVEVKISGGVHNWVDATCDAPQTCANCGATEGYALEHEWIDATCDHPEVCTNCGVTEGSALGHTWAAATCSDPKTCTTCWATEGKKLGHTWNVNDCTVEKTCTVCSYVAPAGDHIYSYTSANVAEHTGTCDSCGATVTQKHYYGGDEFCDDCGYEHTHSLTHVPAKDATCTTTGNVEYWRCSDCGMTFSDEAGTTEITDTLIPENGHSWNEATCITPKTCSVCGETEGEALGHNMVDGTCTRCGYTEAVGGPQIVSQPVDYVGMVGDTATFTVVAEGEGLKYQWYYYDTAASDWKKSSNGATATLSVEFKGYRNNQQYRCEITDGDGNTVTTNIVKIVAKVVDLVIVTQPVSAMGSVNQEMSYTVEATGNGLKYQWYYSDDGGTTWKISGTPGFATNTLLPILRNYRDGYKYYCQITDVFGNTVESDVVSMDVRSSAVTIVTQPEDVDDGLINELHTFKVSATGENLDYRWEYSDDGGETWQLSWNEGYYTDTLTVRLYAARDGYLYRCKITSGLKIVAYTDAVELNLQAPSATIVKQPTNVAVVAGRNIQFYVEATGKHLTYEWYRSNDDGATWIRTYLSGYNTDTLAFAATTARAALYMCRIVDGSGKVIWTNRVQLRILSAELQILTQPEDITCANGATATFHVEAQGDNLKYQWYASGDGGATWTITYLGGSTTDTLSFAVTAARASKLYKCVITDIGGNTVETNAVSVTIS